MLLTSLQILALNWNQYLIDHIYKFGPPMRWDEGSQTFRKESSHRHIWPWLLLNYGVLGFGQFLGSLIFFANLLTVPKYATILQIIVSIGLMNVSIAALFTCIGYTRWGNELLHYYNEMLIFESSLWTRYSPCPSLIIRELGTSKKQKCRRKLQTIQTPDGKADTLGIFSCFVVIAVTLSSLLAPWMGMWLELDIQVIIVQRLFENLVNILGVGVAGRDVACVLGVAGRVLACVLATAEIGNSFRFLALISILGFRSLQSCHLLFLSQPISQLRLRELTQFKIFFTYVQDWMAFLFSTYLAVTFIVLLACATWLVIIINEIPWYLFVFGVLIGFIALTLISVLLYLVVSIDQLSSDLYLIWMRSLAQYPNNFERRVLYRKLKSLKPIRIPYATLGSFKRATRTDFFSSLTVHTLNSILAFGN